MRARVFLFDGESGHHRFAGEVDAHTPDDVWYLAEAEPQLLGRRLQGGDVVYVSDVYAQLDGDGGWHQIAPGELTKRLYGLLRR